jgi:hypothetical protein
LPDGEEFGIAGDVEDGADHVQVVLGAVVHWLGVGLGWWVESV